MEGPLVLKVKFEGVTRRTTVEKPEELTFAGLHNLVRTVLKVPSTTVLTFTYTDEEGDDITLDSDEEVKDVVKNQKLQSLRLNVTKKTSSAQPSSAHPTGSSPSVAPQDVLASLLGQVAQGFQGGAAEPFAKASSQFLQKVLDPNVASTIENLMRKASTEAKSAERSFAEAFQTPTSNRKGEAGSAGSSSSAPAKEASPRPAESPRDSEAPKKTDSVPAPAPPPEEKAKDGQGTDSDPQRDTQFHPGVQCDVCGMLPIVGPRFKSLEKEDYDLCRKCMGEYSDKNEKFTRVERPLFRPRHHAPGYWGPCQFRAGPRSNGPSFGGRPFHPARCGGGPMGLSSKLDARFVRDVTIFDGTEVTPKSTFTKIWRMRNSGAAAWPQNTQLVHVGGDKLGPNDCEVLQVPEEGVQPDAEFEVAVELVAPEKPGRYVSHWRLAAPNGAKFGHRVWCLIQVVPEERDTESNTATAPEAVDSVTGSAPVPEETVVVEPSQPADVNTVKLADGNAPLAPKETPASDEFLPSEVETTVGDFSMVEKSSSASSTPTAAAAEKPAFLAGVVSQENLKPSVELVNEPKVTAVLVAEPEVKTAPKEAKQTSAAEKWVTEVAQLANMGFNDVILMKELLEKHQGSLPATIESLVAAADWDTMLNELEEMGFYDKVMNRHFMVKNNGSLKRCVKDLVAHSMTSAGP